MLRAVLKRISIAQRPDGLRGTEETLARCSNLEPIANSEYGHTCAAVGRPLLGCGVAISTQDPIPV